MIEALTQFPVALVSSFSLVALAEIGDKSQLVCMTLAARYRAWPVLAGAITAFAILNLLAVLFGTALAHWLPEQFIAVTVGILFVLFGIHALGNSGQENDALQAEDKATHGIFLSTVLLIMLAELGDKTQIAVAGMASTADPGAVWAGATLALAATSGAGVMAGRTLLQRIPTRLLHRISGAVFIAFGLTAFSSLFW